MQFKVTNRQLWTINCLESFYIRTERFLVNGRRLHNKFSDDVSRQRRSEAIQTLSWLHRQICRRQIWYFHKTPAPTNISFNVLSCSVKEMWLKIVRLNCKMWLLNVRYLHKVWLLINVRPILYLQNVTYEIELPTTSPPSAPLHNENL